MEDADRHRLFTRELLTTPARPPRLDRLFETGLCLPSGSNLSEEDQDRVIAAVRRVFGTESPTVRHREPLAI